MLFSTLATLHNLKRYLDIMHQMRQSILLGEIPGFSGLGPLGSGTIGISHHLLLVPFPLFKAGPVVGNRQLTALAK